MSSALREGTDRGDARLGRTRGTGWEAARNTESDLWGENRAVAKGRKQERSAWLQGTRNVGPARALPSRMEVEANLRLSSGLDVQVWTRWLSSLWTGLRSSSSNRYPGAGLCPEDEWASPRDSAVESSGEE